MNKINNAIDKIINKSHFPNVYSVNREFMRLGLLRIALGFIIIFRLSQIIVDSSLLNLTVESKTFEFLSLSSLNIIIIICSLCFFIGFLTPISSFCLLILIKWYDTKLGTSTLGTSICQITILPLFLVNSGHYYSLDRYLSTKNIYFSKIIEFIYNFSGSSHKSAIKRAYFLAFLIYYVISFAALTFHLQDPFWLKGLTTKAILINSYISKYYQFFRQLDSYIPFLFSIFSISASIFQSIFQFLMLPLIFTKWGKNFVVVWGFIFFLISLIFINLSYLPHIEIILWLLIFCPVKNTIHPMKIFYDDHCNLCKRAMKFFKYINYNSFLEFLPISKNTNEIEKLGLTQKEINAFMAGTYKNQIYIGYDLYAEICKHNVLLFPFVPIFIVGKLFDIGPFIYEYIAKRRYKYFGRCSLSFFDEIAERFVPIKNTISTKIFNAVFYFYFFATILYVLFNPNLFKYSHSKIAKLSNWYLYLIGYDLPNVFNEIDLKMGQKWMQVSRLDDDKLKLLPFIGEDGQRLNYQNFDYLNFTNHNSDLLYFGTTLIFRRGQIGKNISYYMNEGESGWKNLLRRIGYDYNKRKYKGGQLYFTEVFSNNMSDVVHWKPNKDIYEKKLEFDGWFYFDGTNLIQHNTDK